MTAFDRQLGTAEGRRTALFLLLALTACETQREQLGTAACPSWKRDIAATFEARCVECHGPNLSEGQYRLDDYLESLGTGTNNTPNVRARDPQSQVLTILRSGDGVHGEFLPLEGTLNRWVVDCSARFTITSIHPDGIMDPDSLDFHGQELLDSAWDFAACQECHGEDYAGGSSGVSCLTCHEEGPTDCATCHSDILELGRHAPHVLGGDLEKAYDCDVCHVVPTDFFDLGHALIQSDPNVADPPPAEVELTGPALFLTDTATVYRPETQACTVYCHGDGEDPNAQRPRPSWSDEEPMDCVSCHGEPPEPHPGDACDQCHVSVSSGPGELIDLERHLDRVVNFAAEPDDCTSCHGGMAGSAPPADLDGNVSPSLATVGAHQRHLTDLRFGLTVPVACSECHLVPTAADVSVPGHFDTPLPAEVFPEGDGVGDLARADGADPSYDFEAATCSGTYCHGGGDGLASDQTEGRVEILDWTGDANGQVYCGSCHGAPPAPGHPPGNLTNCQLCHPNTVEAGGIIIFDADGTTRHMNGEVDVGP